MANDRDRDDERGFEVLKLFFEFYKHFTTLSTAVALIVLALSKELDLTTKAAVFGVGMLGVTLFLSLLGMLMSALKAQMHTDMSFEKPGPGLVHILLAIGVVSTFLTTILFFSSLARGFTPQFPVPF